MNNPPHLPRLLFIVGKDPDEDFVSGHSTYVLAYVKAAKRLGYTLDLICLSGSSDVTVAPYGTTHRVKSFLGKYYPKFFPNGIRTMGYPLHHGAYTKGIKKWLEDHPEPVIIHSFSVWGDSAVAACNQLKRKPFLHITCQYTLQLREYETKYQGSKPFGKIRQLQFWGQLLISKYYFSRYERRVYASCDALLVNYKSLKDLIEGVHGSQIECKITPYCTQMAFEDPIASTPPILPEHFQSNKPLIISISRHDPRKGVDVLIEALYRLKGKGVEFNAVLIGSGELFHKNLTLIDELKLNSCVHLAGYVEDLNPWLTHCDIYALPSIGEQSGSMSLLEAMQCGACCISSNIDGMAEDIQNRENGLLVPPSDPDAWSEGLFELIGDPTLREKLGQGARKTFEEKFHPSVLSETLETFYRRK